MQFKEDRQHQFKRNNALNLTHDSSLRNVSADRANSLAISGKEL